MTRPPIEIRSGDWDALDAFLSERIHEFNAVATGRDDAERFGIKQADEHGATIGGASGYTWAGLCFIANLWVAESQRGRGLGAALLRAAERHAIGKGCTIAMLSSHSFQSPGFYARLGYEARETIADYPPGHSDTVFAERLSRDP